MKKPIIYLSIAVLLMFLVQIPFSFANSNVNSKNIKPNYVTSPILLIPTINPFISTTTKMYDSLKLDVYGLSEQAFQYAMQGFYFLKAKGKIVNNHIISIVDFSKPSNQKRLFVIDLVKYKVLFNTYVAHGQGSGQAMATSFSNIPESFQSSLGFYRTLGTYIGKNGFSLKLEGLEYGINDKANERAIVMHGAPYVCQNIIQNQGFLGRSWGCPALPEKLNKPIIEKIKNGSCLFLYSANSKYLNSSKILNT